jgi:20S proteasome alpha/beta subunit
MQAAALPIPVSLIPAAENGEERPVTYQLTMCGCDGMIIASDQQELSKGIRTKVTKIRIDKTGNFAWAYSGPAMVATFSRHLVQAFDNAGPLSDTSAAQLIADCAGPALEESRIYEMPGSGDAIVMLASGLSKKIFRVAWRPTTEVEPIHQTMLIAGQKANLASFLPTFFYSPQMTVDKLASLAAYSIRKAHDCDPLCVDGLDIAVYRDSTRRFEFLDSASCWSEAERIDGAIADLLKSWPSPITIS